MSFEFDQIILVLVTLVAATVTGALGYGFSAITLPVALLFYTNRVLSPAIALIEVAVDSYLLLINLRNVPRVWRRTLPILVGTVPGIFIGGYLLFRGEPGWLKLFTYIALLPLVLLQAAGIRRPISSERAVGILFGGGTGVLYSVTTISGPPLALFFNNQGYIKQDFRAALGVIRLAQSALAAITYSSLGLYSAESAGILYSILPSVLLGMPIGAYMIRRMDAETFRRICMSFDAWVVSFGLSRVLIELKLVASPMAYSVLLAVVVIDTYLLYLFFTNEKRKVRTVGGT